MAFLFNKSVSSLKSSDRIREGFAKKAAISKGIDECRGNWQERWFVLIKHELHYYKRKEDNTPKGTIDLRAAHVDGISEDKTGKPFCIRIGEAKQVFVYLQLNSEEDREKWAYVLRIAAGYDKNNLSLADEQKLALMAASAGNQAKLLDIRNWDDRNESLCSYSGLLLSNNEQEHPDRIVISLAHIGEGIIRIVKSDTPWIAF